jgi:hypothetical protein
LPIRTSNEATPLFSLVATMLPEAFMAFGQFTEGASAIQSRSYKTLESLCRKLDPERLSGRGYDAVPDVRARARRGWLTFEEALAHGRFPPQDLAKIHAAMKALEAEMLGWRRTHHNLAARMLGMKRGAGYTVGVPYLAETTDVPLFACPFAGSAHRENKREGSASYRGSLIAARRAAQVLR